MSPRKALSGKDVRNILENHGFQLVRQRGSHQVLQKQLKHTTITVPVPNHKDLKAGTLASIIRQSQLPKSAFDS